MHFQWLVGVSFFLLISSGCSPLKSSPLDGMHQWELTVHEVQTNLDDLRHDLNCFRTEVQILDGRIKHFETALASLKQQELEKQQTKLDLLVQQLHALEKKWGFFEKSQEEKIGDWEQLLTHANETTAALAQFKDRIQELEHEILSQNKRFEDVAKLKGNIENLAKNIRSNNDGYKIYKVRPGDSLEKIARSHKTAVDRIRKLNHLDEDLIVVGQELKIPID